MIYIYYSYINEAIHNTLLEKYLKKFPLGYQNKVLSFQKWEDAQLSLLGRLLLIYGMDGLDKKFDDFQLEYTDYHKPFFKDSDLKFNISHSGNMVVLVIHEELEVGVDVELMNHIKIGSFKGQMTVGEWEKVNNVEDDISAFYEYWTKKEAVVKALGKGLLIPLKSFEIIEEKTSIEDSFFVLREIPLDKNYKCSLALMTKNDEENANLMFSKEVVVKQVNFDKSVSVENRFTNRVR